jgi:hypothetical protein
LRHTKIIATVGPASDSAPVLDALIAAGADIFRLNFSHGTHESQAATFARVRAASQRACCEVAILQDLGGPKIRTGRLGGGRAITLVPGETVLIVTGDGVGGPGRLYTSRRPARACGPATGCCWPTAASMGETTNGVEIETVLEGGEWRAQRHQRAGRALPTRRSRRASTI